MKSADAGSEQTPHPQDKQPEEANMVTQASTEQTAILRAITDASNRFRHGDSGGFDELYADEGVTLFGAKGGYARGRESVLAVTRRASAALGVGGEARYEVLALRVCGDLAYMSGLEHIEAPIASENVTLRVTNILAKEHGTWRLLHRHANPLQDSPFS